MMNCIRGRYVVAAVMALLLVTAVPAGAAEPEKEYESFDSGNFDHSTIIDNEWFTLKPGMRYIWDGTAYDEEGDEEPHSIVSTVTDLTKEIAGVRTLVCWDKDIADGELEESEIIFFAQDNDGTVWLLGEYPEEYESHEFKATACWIHGIKDGKAGIIMPAEPKLGMPSYSEGWAPSVDYTDRGLVYQMGQKVTVPVGTYEDVLVIDESNNEVPGAHHLKYYARGAGNVYVGWRGKKTDQETLSLIKVEKLSDEELAKARDEALKLEKHGYEVDKDVFGHTKPSERVSANAIAQ